MQNINSFLGALTSQFGLKPADVFEADDLFYAADFNKVKLLDMVALVFSDLEI
jgi:hypothetical protein